MMQLIVAVIAILLLVILVIASIFFGGSVYSESSQRALYAENVNAASQIDGALQLYYQDHVAIPTGSSTQKLATLKDMSYLRDIPKGEWVISADQLYKPIDDLEQCRIMNKVAGKDISTEEKECPPCGDAGYKDYPGCTMPN